VRQRRRRETLAQQEAAAREAQEREQRLKELAETRTREYWERRNQEAEEERRIQEAGELRRRLAREAAEHCAVEKAKDIALFQQLLQQARTRAKGIESLPDEGQQDGVAKEMEKVQADLSMPKDSATEQEIQPDVTSPRAEGGGGSGQRSGLQVSWKVEEKVDEVNQPKAPKAGKRNDLPSSNKPSPTKQSSPKAPTRQDPPKLNTEKNSDAHDPQPAKAVQTTLPKILPRTESGEKKGVKRQLLHMGRFKELLQSKFKSVFDAFVFFDHMKVNFVSTMNLKRGLVKLAADELIQEFPALVRDLEWQCVDHGKIHCGEFIQLFSWHHISDFNKELSAARLVFDRETRAVNNKAISIKATRPTKPTPVCDKLRDILKSKYQTIAAFMVVADMDVNPVLSFNEMVLAFRLASIQGIDVEELASELSDPSFPPTAIRSHAFKKVLGWHSLEEIDDALKDERLKMFRDRNTMEKGLPKIPLPAGSLPFFRERPEVEKATLLMKKHFDNAADAFVFFDHDNSGEITRVKMAHGLQRLQQLDGGDVTMDFDKLMPEMQNLQFTGGCIDAAGFIWNFRWHEKFPDITEAVWIARRKKFERSAVIPPQKGVGKVSFKSSDRKQFYSIMKTHGKGFLPGLLGGTVSMDEWLRNKEVTETLHKIATVRIVPTTTQFDQLPDRNGAAHACAGSGQLETAGFFVRI
jgi:Ca2+-binding EF-hand superfamily protein